MSSRSNGVVVHPGSRVREPLDASLKRVGDAVRQVTVSYADGRRRILVANSDGLLTEDMPALGHARHPYSAHKAEVEDQLPERTVVDIRPIGAPGSIHPYSVSG